MISIDLLTPKGEHKCVRQYWEANADTERCWILWVWCDDVKTQPEHSSIVLFASDNDMMHAVRAHYGHLQGQRTKLYGNPWLQELGDLTAHDRELFALEKRKLTWGRYQAKTGFKPARTGTFSGAKGAWV